MEGLAHASGTGSWVPDASGKMWYLAPKYVEILAEIEQMLTASKINPIDAVLPEVVKLKNLNMGDEAKYLLDKAYADLRKDKKLYRVSAQEVLDWTYTEDGFTFVIMRQLQIGAEEKGLGEVTKEKAIEIMEHDLATAKKNKREAMLPKLSDMGSGLPLDHLGNSTGQTSTAESLAEKKPESPGEKSSGDSPTSTDGVLSRYSE